MNNSRHQYKSPKFARWLLACMVRYEDRTAITGDFDEAYREVYLDRGVFRAAFWYWSHILTSLPAFTLNTIYWSAIMLKNYLIDHVPHTAEKYCNLVDKHFRSCGRFCVLHSHCPVY